MSPRAIPMDPNLSFVKDMGPQAPPEPEQYHKLVRALMHFTNCTRLDVSYSVDVLARYN